MKKVVLFVMVTIFITSMAWGQAETRDLLDGNVFDAFNVVPTESVESYTSFGVFGSMIDDFIHVNYFDPQVGTFAFMGGIHDNSLNQSWINFGFAKTFGFGYLGVYYGGHLVNAEGYREKLDADNKDLNSLYEESEATWRNSIAVLFGTRNIGAFRLDLQIDSVTDYDNDNGSGETNINPGLLFGITWGGVDFFGLNPYITLGVQLPTARIINAADDDTSRNKSYTRTDYSGGFFGIQTGVDLDSGIWGDLSLIFNFDNSSIGEVAAPGTGSTKVNRTWGGDGFLGGIRVGYANTWDAGRLSFGIGPELRMAFGASTYYLTDKENSDNNIELKDSPTYTNFQLQAVFNTGLKFQVTEKFNLYTGLGLQFFDFQSGSMDLTSGKDKYHETEWLFDGIEWISGQLQFGLTFTPIEGLIIGADISSFLGRFFTVNPATMRASTVFANSNANNTGDWATSFFRNLSFGLTVSYQFSGSGSGSSSSSDSDSE